MRFDQRKAIEILAATPKTLRALLSELSEEWVYSNEGPSTFSPFDVVGHLIHGERTDWMPRVRVILEHGASKPFEPFDRFAMWEENRGEPLSVLLDTFETLRRANLMELEELGLSEADFDRKGMHPELGEVTLGQLIATWAVHDLNHIGQIARVMSRQYEDEVGPWRAYLGILG